MSVATRRILYGLLTALGFALIVPLAVKLRLWEAELPGPQAALGLGSAIDPSEWVRPFMLALIGVALASGFLYAALSVGYPRAWRPQEDGLNRCSRCCGEVGFGVGRCPTCDQHMTW